MKRKTVIWSFLLIFALGACTVTSAPATEPPAVTLPPLPSPANTTPPASAGGGTQSAAIGNPALPSAQIPVTWSDLNLTGTLVFNTGDQSGNVAVMRIQALDLVSGLLTTIFETGGAAIIYGATVSGDERELVMAYTAPVGTTASNSPGLYVLPLDGSAPPRLVFEPASKDDEYLQPEFSADGRYLYFSHVNYAAEPIMQDQHYPIFEVYRMAYPDGEPVKIADQAYWPRPSDDGNQLAYVSLDPLHGKNQLFVANSDGSNPTQPLTHGPQAPDIIDAPMFLPDNQTLLFSAVTPTAGYTRNWVAKILGFIPVSAHTVPSDWWSVPLAGGAPTQLTQLGAVSLFASTSPDKQHIASYSGQGIFVMNPDGTSLTYLLNDTGGVPGTLSWIP